MPIDKKKRGLVARGTVKNENIRVAVNDPSLASRLKVDVQNTDGPIFWYIKFNIVLDPESVSPRTMTVTEQGGYILDTVISYDMDKNVIVIKPTDPYEEGVFYILNIDKRVRSQGGNRLKRDIHILFKIKDNKIEEYKMLAPNVQVAKPRRKPERLKAETAARVYGFTPKQQKKLDNTAKDMLPYDRLRFNVTLALIGLFAAITGMAAARMWLVLGGGGVIAAGIAHLFLQFRDKKRKAGLHYNIGAMLFNAGFYSKAEKRFKKAAALDVNNEMAEYALNKLSFYR